MLITYSLLGRGNLAKMWLTLRRAIALAEIVGLPRAAHKDRISGDGSITGDIGGQEATASARLELWDAICATDRNCSMM